MKQHPDQNTLMFLEPTRTAPSLHTHRTIGGLSELQEPIRTPQDSTLWAQLQQRQDMFVKIWELTALI